MKPHDWGAGYNDGSLCVDHSGAFTPRSTLITFLAWVSVWLVLYEGWLETGRSGDAMDILITEPALEAIRSTVGRASAAALKYGGSLLASDGAGEAPLIAYALPTGPAAAQGAAHLTTDAVFQNRAITAVRRRLPSLWDRSGAVSTPASSVARVPLAVRQQTRGTARGGFTRVLPAQTLPALWPEPPAGRARLGRTFDSTEPDV